MPDGTEVRLRTRLLVALNLSVGWSAVSQAGGFLIGRKLGCRRWPPFLLAGALLRRRVGGSFVRPYVSGR